MELRGTQCMACPVQSTSASICPPSRLSQRPAPCPQRCLEALEHTSLSLKAPIYSVGAHFYDSSLHSHPAQCSRSMAPAARKAPTQQHPYKQPSVRSTRVSNCAFTLGARGHRLRWPGARQLHVQRGHRRGPAQSSTGKRLSSMPTGQTTQTG